MKSSKVLIILSLMWSTVLLMLGSWWIYILINFDKMNTQIDHFRFSKMLYWEGSSFIILLILLSSSLMGFYLKDQRKTKSLHDFFASLTHELKTPLASIKLQGEVIEEVLKNNAENRNEKQLKTLLSRLIEDTVKLETQMDKILQLSRIERGGELNLTSVTLVPFIRNIFSNLKYNFELNIHCDNSDLSIMADEFALELILKNLFENTKNHSKSNIVDINITQNQKMIYLVYSDHGKFSGEVKKLATLFYKYNSTKGSGIGLYLIKKLMHKMQGHFDININSTLSFNLGFMASEAIIDA